MKSSLQELDPPPFANSEPSATEILRVWAVPTKGQQLTLKTTWDDPGAWGLLLADVARHVARAYANDGLDPVEALARIRLLLEAEFARPTDEPKELA